MSSRAGHSYRMYDSLPVWDVAWELKERCVSPNVPRNVIMHQYAEKFPEFRFAATFQKVDVLGSAPFGLSTSLSLTVPPLCQS